MGYTMVVAIVPLAAEDLLGSPRWSGLPSSLGTTGVAVGTTWLALLILRVGRRGGLVAGYATSAAAAVFGAASASSGAFLPLAASLFVLGAGYASSRLSRYAAAELFEPARRSAAIGWNVWAATIGAVVGPLLLESTRRLSASMGLPDTSGPFMVAAATFLVAAAAVQTGYTPAHAAGTATASTAVDAAPSAPRARLAVVALVAGQVVMILVMTMTPIHLRHGGQGLDWVGAVFASHTFGMFALSPVAGLLADRVGRVPVIVAGCAMLAGAGVLASVAPMDRWPLAFALFLLGLGWCFSFVAGSALLTESVSAERRVRVQGVTDSIVWGSAALAGLLSGVLLADLGYETLGRLGAVLAVVPLVFVRGGGARGARGA